METLSLLLEDLDVLVLSLDLGLETGNLARLADARQLFALLGVLVGALVLLQDQREEQREPAEVHVALAVEFAGLYFEALVAHDYCASVGGESVRFPRMDKRSTG
jgi:hypothetical protein